MYCEFKDVSKTLDVVFSDPYFQEITISDWNEGFSIKVKSGGSWIKPLYPPDIVLAGYGPYSRLVREYLEKLLPKDVYEMTNPFAFRHLFLLQLMADYREAYDLAGSNIVLLWMLACRFIEEETSDAKIREILVKKQTEQLTLLFGRGNDSIVKFLAKCRSALFTDRQYSILKRAIKNDQLISSVRHHPEVPVNLIPTLSKIKQLMNTRMVGYWLKRGLETDTDLKNEALQFQAEWARCRMLGRVLRIENLDAQMRRCSSPWELSSLLQNWENKAQTSIHYLNARQKAENSEQNDILDITTKKEARAPQKKTTKSKTRERTYKRKPVRYKEPGEFPAPPIPGNDFIQAITTEEELIAEGIHQKNCVRSYIKKVNSGKSYFYRFVEPRITIEIRKIRKKWVLGQTKLSCNRNPAKRYRQIIIEWFEAGLIDSSSS